MKTMNLLENLEFHENAPFAQPLSADGNGRILRFMLKPGQSIKEHKAGNSPFHVVVLQGQGIFSGGDGAEHQVGPNAVLTFDPGEMHSVRALDEEFVFVGFLPGVPDARTNRTSGIMGEA